MSLWCVTSMVAAADFAAAARSLTDPDVSVTEVDMTFFSVHVAGA